MRLFTKLIKNILNLIFHLKPNSEEQASSRPSQCSKGTKIITSIRKEEYYD